MLKFFYCSIESIYKMFVYKVLWIFTVKCLQLFNKELYVYFCTDSILSCFSWIQPITVTKAAALVHFAMTWLDAMALHWCYCRSKGRIVTHFLFHPSKTGTRVARPIRSTRGSSWGMIALRALCIQVHGWNNPNRLCPRQGYACLCLYRWCFG